MLSEWGLNQVDECEPVVKLITIPEERITAYKQFIQMFNFEDNNESRDQFLTISH
ncbi:hypothetical protein GQR36_03225 [Enterococcus termitis]